MISRLDIVRILQNASITDLFDVGPNSFQLQSEDINLTITVEEKNARKMDDHYIVVPEEEWEEANEVAEDTLYRSDNEWEGNDKVIDW